MEERLIKQYQFSTEIEKLKCVLRTNQTLDNHRFENSAEHSWQAALVAIILQEHYEAGKVDIDKVIKMLLVHDLGELNTGDTCVFDDTLKLDSYDREYASLMKTLSILPEDQSKVFLELWKEFEDGITSEAKYAKIIDALLPLINHLEVAEDNYNPYQLTKQKVIDKKIFIKDYSANLWELALTIIDKSVEKGLYI